MRPGARRPVKETEEVSGSGPLEIDDLPDFGGDNGDDEAGSMFSSGGASAVPPPSFGAAAAPLSARSAASIPSPAAVVTEDETNIKKGPALSHAVKSRPMNANKRLPSRSMRVRGTSAADQPSRPRSGSTGGTLTLSQRWLCVVQCMDASPLPLAHAHGLVCSVFDALDVSQQPKKSSTEERPTVSPVKKPAPAAAAAPAVVNTDDLLSSLSMSSSVLDGDFKMPSFSTSTSTSTSSSSIFGGSDDMFGSANGAGASAAKPARGAAKIGLFDDPTPSSSAPAKKAPSSSTSSSMSASVGGDDSFDIFSNPLMGKKEKEEREKKRREDEERQAKAAAPPPDIFADPLSSSFKGSSSFF
jgi:hypothetical protein